MAKESKAYELHDGKTQVIIGDDFSNRREMMLVHNRDTPDLVAKLTFSLVEKFGVIAGMPDGEDSAGRQKGALLPPDEVASRAYAIASKTVALLTEHGHIQLAPKLRQMDDADA